MTSRQGIPLTILGLTLVLGSSPADAQTIYWTQAIGITIRRADVWQLNIQTLVAGAGAPPTKIALDLAAGKMYWADNYDAIQRANQDGSNHESVVTGLSQPFGIALDPDAGKMYFTEGGRIDRADLDGSNVETLLFGLAAPGPIAVDPDAGKMYWGEGTGHRIQRADLDGSNVEPLVLPLCGPFGIALDLDAGKIYWADGPDPCNQIQRANLDGSNVETLMTSVDAMGIALDLDAGKMYWSDASSIYRANLDGSSNEVLITVPAAIGLALDPISLPVATPTLSGWGFFLVALLIMTAASLALASHQRRRGCATGSRAPSAGYLGP